MLTATLRRPWAALTLFAGLAFSPTARAQTAAPTWRWGQVATTATTTYLSSLATDAAGNTYTAGDFRTSLTLAPGTTLTPQGNSDAYVAKYGPGGDLLWVRQLTGPGSETVARVVLDAAGNVCLAGNFTSSLQLGGQTLNSSGLYVTMYLARLDAQGQALWLHQASTSGASAYAMGLDAAGNFYLSGSFANQMVVGSFSLASPNAVSRFLVKYDAQGVPQWARQGGSIPFVNSSVSSYAQFLTVSPAGDSYLSWTINATAGAFAPLPEPTSYGDYDATLVCYDPQGTARWQKRYGTTRLDYAGPTALDGSGHLLATMTFPGSLAASLGSQTLTGTGQSYGTLLQLDAATGSLGWARTLNTDNASAYQAVAVDAAGNSYAAGYFAGSASPGSQPLNSSGQDAVVVSYSPQGTFRWAQKSDGAGPEGANFLALGGPTELAVGGYFTGTGQLGSTPLASGGATVTNSFVARFTPLPTATQAARPLALGLYPNPATDLVRLPALAPGTRIQVVDAGGRLAREAVVTPAAQVSVRGLVPGLYALRAVDAQGRPYAGRLVVE